MSGVRRREDLGFTSSKEKRERGKKRNEGEWLC